MLRISSAAASHPGLRREENEDAYCTSADLGLYLVCDGMGGHAAGEIASRTVVDAVAAFIEDSRDATPEGPWPLPYEAALSLAANRLRMALTMANRRLGAAIAGNGSLRGMATTATGLLLEGDTAVVANVGDSRTYVWRDGALRQITEDHSWVGEQVRAGVLSEADARHHPWRNVVTRAITGGEDPDVELTTIEPRAGDRLLLCSDGLSSVVPSDVIARLVAEGNDLAVACDRLIAAANAAGGPDNITVAILQIDVA